MGAIVSLYFFLDCIFPSLWYVTSQVTSLVFVTLARLVQASVTNNDLCASYTYQLAHGFSQDPSCTSGNNKRAGNVTTTTTTILITFAGIGRKKEMSIRK